MGGDHSNHDLEQPLMDRGHGGHGGHGGHDGHGHSDHGHSHESRDHGHGGHGHDHGHASGDGYKSGSDSASSYDNEMRLKKAVIFALLFMFVEIVGGLAANSLAIITDAAHMLSDVGGFIVSLVALQLSRMEATQEYTYGFKQAEVLGALLSVAIVWALTAVLLWEAVPRFIEPRPIDGRLMFFISLFGFGVNLILMQVLGHGHSHGGDDHGHSHGDDHDNVAVQAALAHVIGDVVQSLGVCVAALCIWLQPLDVGSVWTARGEVSKWNYADPMCTCLFGVIVLHTTKATMVRTTETLMGKAPSRIDQNRLASDIEKIPNVVSIHDLHVWTMGSSTVFCTAHVVVSKQDHQVAALRQAIQAAKRAGVGHVTFQMEVFGDMPLADCGGCDGLSPELDLEKGHGHDSHGHDSHGHDSHGHDSHGSDSHGHESHGHDSHGHDSHGHDSHGSDSHGHDSPGHDSHGQDSNGHSHSNGRCNGHAH